jgi:hypothetical protein
MRTPNRHKEAPMLSTVSRVLLRFLQAFFTIKGRYKNIFFHCRFTTGR